MRRLLLPLAAAGISLAGCDDPNQLADPSITNRVDTVAMYAIDGTSVRRESAFSIDLGRPVRIDIFSGFDFAFNLDQQGRIVFLPARVVGLPESSVDPGFIKNGVPFDQVTVAPLDGYITLDSIIAQVGDNYSIRSRILCSVGTPKYGKINVLGVNTHPETLSVTLEVLVNQNCGYIGLAPGLPDV